MPTSPRWATHRFAHLFANSDWGLSSGRKLGEKAVMRPADFVPMICWEGISSTPRSCTTLVLLSGRISSSTTGLVLFPRADSSATSRCPSFSAWAYSSSPISIPMGGSSSPKIYLYNTPFPAEKQLAFPPAEGQNCLPCAGGGNFTSQNLHPLLWSAMRCYQQGVLL